MKGDTMRTFKDGRSGLPGTIAFGLIAAAVAVSCSGNSVSSLLSCGPGTHPVDGQCVPVASDGGPSADAGPVQQQNGPDASDSGGIIEDASGAEYDSAPNSEGGITPESGPVSDGSDPCPPTTASTPVQCDPACPGSTPSTCSMVTCASSATVMLNLGNSGDSTIVRTPDHPGTDPNCRTQCDSGPYVYGMGFILEPPFFPVLITVGSPWVILTEGGAQPFCNVSGSVISQGCYFLGQRTPNSLPQPVYIMTSDPEAPARNITFFQENVVMGCP
jgi:hypothetical protein